MKRPPTLQPPPRPALTLPPLDRRDDAEGRVRSEGRALFSSSASTVHFRKGETIYRPGDPADYVYNVATGVVKSYSVHGGQRLIHWFLFSGDLFGLTYGGRYTNFTQAITAVTVFRWPTAILRERLEASPTVHFRVIDKLCDDIRQAQRHAIIVRRRDATARLAMVLQFLEEMQALRNNPSHEIYLPMSRTELGEFAGLSLASVSRAFRRLVKAGVIGLRNQRHVKIENRAAFDAFLADDPER